ncbi:MAG TPA: LLM class F420-dependent oxidoreductase [Chloroflexota bacterium]|nr:LLM class F420-dependent oxidoreductase [Chloroflexota bacterium]
MKLGVVFPQTEIGNDPLVIRDYAQAAEALGYNHLLAFDHVVGGHPDRFQGQRPPPYTHESAFHEPFVLFGCLAAMTTRLELVVGVLVLPQRQTALVAKQAAEVQALSQGRLRLGVGIGWNFVEYETLGENFKSRGARIEEQIEVLRRLWSQDLVDYAGKYHTLHRVGINPRPPQPIPIWMGGTADVVLRRTARLADGWFPQAAPGPELDEMLQRLRRYVREAGRRPEDVGVEGRLSIAQTPEREWAATVGAWRAAGADYLCVNTMRAGLASPHAHIDAIRRFKDAVEA